MNKKDGDSQKNFPPLTILKPVKGREDSFEDNLLSFCCQDYPEYQVIIGGEHQEPCLNIARGIKARFPEKDIVVCESDQNLGTNGKVSTLIQLSRYAKYDIFVVADSDIRVDSKYLKAIIPPLTTEKVGLVTCLYRSVMGRGMGWVIESLSIGFDFLPSVLLARGIGDITFAFGATMAFKKEALQKIGGFEGLVDYLADDYLLGNRIYNTGYKVRLSSYLVDIIAGQESLREYLARQLRWARTYRICRPWGYMFSVLTHGTSFSLAYLISKGMWGIEVLTGYLIFRFLHAFLINLFILKDKSLIFRIPFLPIRDIFSTLFWFMSFIGNTVSWKDRKFRISRDGRMREIGTA